MRRWKMKDGDPFRDVKGRGAGCAEQGKTTGDALGKRRKGARGKLPQGTAQTATAWNGRESLKRCICENRRGRDQENV